MVLDPFNSPVHFSNNKIFRRFADVNESLSTGEGFSDFYSETDQICLDYRRLTALANPSTRVLTRTNSPQKGEILEAGLEPRYIFYLLLSFLLELLGFLKIPVPDNLADDLLGRFKTSKLTFRDRYINRELNGRTKNFLEGMKYLVEKQQFRPEEAYQSIIKYILTRRSVDLKDLGREPELIDGYYDLKEEDVLRIEKEYEIKADRMDRIAGEVAAELRMEEMGRRIREPLTKILQERQGEMALIRVQEVMKETRRDSRRLEDALSKREAVLEEEIRATNRGAEFLLETLDNADPLSSARKGFLLALSRTKSKVMGLNHNGGDFAVAFLDSSMKIYKKGESRVGPYTFYESSYARIDKNGLISYEPAMAYVDRRGSPGILSLSEMKNLLLFEEKIGSLLKTHSEGGVAAKAYSRFLFDLQRAWHSIDWSDERGNLQIRKGERKRILGGARLLSQLAPGYELIRKIRELLGESKEERIHASPEAADWIAGGLLQTLGRYENFFQDPRLRSQYLDQMRRFSDAVAARNEGDILEARERVKALIYEQMDLLAGEDFGRLAGNVRTDAFGEEVSGWVEVIRKQFLGGTLPPVIDRGARVGQDHRHSPEEKIIPAEERREVNRRIEEDKVEREKGQGEAKKRSLVDIFDIQRWRRRFRRGGK